MNKLTPSESRIREKEINSFDEHWYIDTQTSEIRHKPLSVFYKIIDFFWRKKHTVADLYWWSVKKWDSSEMISCPNAIKHDNVPIVGFPRKHQMKNGWTIPTKDFKYLYEGPLVDETGNKILIKHQSKIQKLVSIFSQLRPLSWIITLIIACYRYRNEISDLWSHLSNAI